LRSIFSVEASATDLISAEEAEDMASVGKTWEFGPSFMAKEMITVLEKEGYIPEGKAKPTQGDMVPKLGAADAVFFKDLFASSLRFLAMRFLWEVLELFQVQLHQLTPNGVLTLSKFCWACESYGVEPDLDTFYEYYEL